MRPPEGRVGRAPAGFALDSGARHFFKATLAALGLAVLTACASGEDPVTKGTRDAARDVVNDIVADRFPGADVTPYTDCIIDNASASELLRIAKGALLGIDGTIVGLVVDIAQRKETVLCVLEKRGLG